MGNAIAAYHSERAVPRRLVALAVPVAVPIAMVVVFSVTGDRLGQQGGYMAGFLIYWLACGALSLAILGRRGLRPLFRDVRPRLGKPAGVGAALLLWPPVGAIATRLIPDLGEATLAMACTAITIAVINGFMEELLWRGVYICLWPRNRWLGWVWPAIGFGAWHLAPQMIHPSPLGPIAYVVSATALGLSWGWVAWRTGSVRWVTLSHVITDASGIRNALFFLAS
jgi:membrane protease YdiL (CAAX protease family)